MINKKFDQIEISDIKSLIENEIPESKTLEYKRELNISKGDKRKEFLADVSAFANAIGGDLIFGIEEDKDTNLPIQLCGIECSSVDELILRLESMIRDSISPRISKVDVKAIENNDGVYVIIIRIGRSYLAPHRVTYNGHDKFYSRDSKGKYPMDVNDLRTSFNTSQNISDKIETFKSKRIDAIIQNKYDNFEKDSTIFILHMMPSSAFEFNALNSIIEIEEAISKSGSGVFDNYIQPKYNVDGAIQYINPDYSNRANCNSYAQYYKNGIIEAVTKKFFNPSFISNCYPSQNIKIIYIKNMVENTLKSVKLYLKYMQALDIVTPIILAVSITNTYGYEILSGSRDSSSKIDRDMLFIENVMIDSYDQKPEDILKPIFNSIWNACGYESCYAYDEEGKYIGLK